MMAGYMLALVDRMMKLSVGHMMVAVMLVVVHSSAPMAAHIHLLVVHIHLQAVRMSIQLLDYYLYIHHALSINKFMQNYFEI